VRELPSERCSENKYPGEGVRGEILKGEDVREGVGGVVAWVWAAIEASKDIRNVELCSLAQRSIS
jgi:hypothetical protein